MKSTDRLPEKWLLLTALSLIWGSSFILMKHGLVALEASQVAAIRMLVACLASFPFIAHRVRSVQRTHLPYMAIVGVVGSGIPAFLFATAQTRINSSLAGMLNALTPVFTMLVGSVMFSSRFTTKQIIGVLVGFVGAAGLILIKGGHGETTNAWFALLIIIATLCYGISVNTIKAKLQGADALLITGVALLFVGIPYGIYLFTTDFTTRLQHLPGAWTSFGYIALLAIMGTALSSFFYFKLVKIAGPLFASAVTYCMPVISLLWGVIDGESLNPFHVLGMITILAGVALISSKPKP